MASRAHAPLDPTPLSSTASARRVAYYYDPDVGNYVYYMGHPMKPHRIRMAHNLIVNYGLCDNLDDAAGRPAPHWGWSNGGGIGNGSGSANGQASGSGLNGSSDTYNASAGPSSFATSGPTSHSHLPSTLTPSLAPGHRWADPSYTGAGQDSVLPRDSFMRLQNRAIDLGERESRLDRPEYVGRRMQVFRPRRAEKGDMTRFHSDEYIEFLEKVTPETVEALTGNGVRCLTGDDCPAWEGLFEFCSISAGGSIAAAERLNSGAADIAINWAGGLHHAKKTEASGFCYVNDIVLGILELLRVHPRVLYIDVDVHHGDGVEEAFYTTDRVMTASFHRFGEFFPGTGDVRDIGMKRGKGYSVNVPLRDGITDDAFHSIFKPVISKIMETFRPGAVVLQMGADSLSGDKLGGFNLTLQGHGECAAFLKTFGVPVMMLGGGGYTTKNVARAWTNETAVMCGVRLPEDLPYNQYMEYYGPRYKLEVLSNNTDNHNPPEYLEAIKQSVFENIRNYVNVPSVQMQAVPDVSIGQALGMSRAVRIKPDDPDDEVDERIREHFKRRDQPYGADSDDSDSELGEARDARRRGHINISGGRRTMPIGARGNSRLLDPCGTDHGSEDGRDDRIKSKRRRFFKATGLQTGLAGNLAGAQGQRNGLSGSATGYATPPLGIGAGAGVGDGKNGQTRTWLAGLTGGNGNGNSNGNGSTGPTYGRSALSGTGNGTAAGTGTVLEWGNGAAGVMSRAASPMSVV